MNREQIEARIAELEAANEAATSWGAAVGARHEEIKGLKRALDALDHPSRSADIGDVTERVIRENPYTKYTFAAQNNAVESIRAARYATMVARRVFKELATDAPAQAVGMPTHEELREAIANGFANGNSNYSDFSESMQLRFESAAYAVAALASQPSPAATVEPRCDNCRIILKPNEVAPLCERCRENYPALTRCSAASEVPFLTGEALRQSLRGSDCLAAEAEVNGRSEEQELERLAEIAERAKQHWLAANRLAAEPQPTAGSEPAAWLSTGDNHRGLWREKPDLGDGFQVQPLYLRAEPQGVPETDADLGDLSGHTVNCDWYESYNDSRCKCSLRLRQQLATERTMHRAWRKRAEEAEATLALSRPEKS